MSTWVYTEFPTGEVKPYTALTADPVVKRLVRLAWRYGMRQAQLEDYSEKVGKKALRRWYYAYRYLSRERHPDVRKLMRDAYWGAGEGRDRWEWDSEGNWYFRPLP